jgi:hypothetical protein
MDITCSQLAMLLHGLNLAESERLELLRMIGDSGADINGDLMSVVDKQIDDIRTIKPIIYRFFSEIERAIDAAEEANDN